LGSLNLNFDVIVSSPLIRARETAGILMTAGLSDRYEEHEFLAPDGKITDFWTWLQPQLPLEAIALVGHQPDLGHWAELLVWGKVQEKIILKKAGIIGIKMPHTTKSWQGTGDLLTLISPKWILT
jgi:phosphohistidine phosphatase